MDVKRYFRGPVIWVVLAVVAVLAVMQLVSSAGGPKSVDTSVVLDAIHRNQVVSAKLVGGSGSSIEVKVDPKQLREQARNALREQKFEKAYTDWIKDLRDKAFIEMREPPA